MFGVPFFLFAGEPFWGYDRMPLLEQRWAEAGLALDADRRGMPERSGRGGVSSRRLSKSTTGNREKDKP